MNTENNIESFIKDWDEKEICRNIFIDLKNFIASLENTKLEFHARPGVTYSLRGCSNTKENFPLFVMVDVIDDKPRWLSVCFYGQKVTDPDNLGDYVPGGLLGEDGICFDLEDVSEQLIGYIKQRILEAHKA